MKKSTINAIVATLSTIDFENKDAVMSELTAELNRGADVKAAKAAKYDAIKSIVLDALTETPATIGEIFDAISDELPDGVTKAMVQYGITRLWKDEIVKVEGNPATYKKA